MKLKFRADLKDIVIFLIFCVVLLLLIAIAVLNLNSLATEGIFRGINPFPAFSGEFLLPTLVFFALAMVAIFTMVSTLFFEREKGFGITTAKKSKNDGYTKLWEEADMKKDYGIKKIVIKDDTYEAGGFPVINNGKVAYVDDGENHSLIMGASGSGKSQSFMKPLIRILGRAGESMIVTDPKGELYESCANLLKEKGYKILLINFRDPEYGSAWNPFSYPYRVYKEGNFDKANELLQDLASNILIDPNNKAEPFWEQTASNFFTGLSLGLFDDATENEVNINSVNLMAETGEDRIGASTYIKEYFKSKGELSPAYIAAASCINAPNETRGGIMSTFRTKTRIFSSQQMLSEMLSYSDFDMRDIGKEKTAVFLKIHDEKTTYHALATIFVKQVYESLIAVAQTCPNLKLPYRTNFVLDEFANMPALKDVESMITASRSRRIRFNFVIQNFSQLNKVYGKDVAETIKGNCGNFVYLMSTELAALEEISKLLGDQKPPKAEKDKPAPPIRPLFTVSDLQALKEGEVIINRFRSMPFKTKLTYDYKIDWGKKHAEADYVKRDSRKVETFDLKAFVNKQKESQGVNVNPSSGGPMMMNNPFMPQGPIPGISHGNAVPTSLDDYVKKLDEKIAELEAEEAAEKAKMEQEKMNIAGHSNDVSNITVVPLKEKTEEEIEREISDILDRKTPPKENKFVTQTPELPKELDEEKENKFIAQVPKLPDELEENLENKKKEEIERPKVNIDVDSVVVNNTPTNENFFDDF
ncbi:MAG: type IV secretory system conjugative DNA transfer family protein, partial [Tenericutes bacterium]|nr:type IV secretory system conjugative DNA transfer family protein [Mycoplasmatota bacterium]